MTEIPSVIEQKSLSSLIKSYTALLQKAFGAARVRTWAESVGFTSRISFKHFLMGRRSIAPGIQEKIKQSLDLTESERKAFDQLAQSKSSIPQQLPTTIFVSEDFFQTPINTLILNLCGVKTKMTRADLQEILRGAFTPDAINESIQKLLDLKLIQVFETDFFVRSFEGVITTVPGQKSLASKEYFRVCHGFAERAWELPLQEREMHSFTFRMRAEDIPKLKDLIRDFRKDVYELGKNADKDSVFQCSVSAFPVFLEKH